MPTRTASHRSKVYYEYSHLYERVFEKFFGRRMLNTIGRLTIPPDARILEVGVGTGLSLAAYPTNAEVVGIDLSDAMLLQAQEKVTQNNWSHVTLQQMDALNMTFPDESFDFVFGFHIVSVVPDYERLMNEMLRVCKTDGMIVIINHFRSERPWVAALVDRLDPLTRQLGWRTTLRFDDIRLDPLRVERRYKTSGRSLFTIVQARKGNAANGQSTVQPNGQMNAYTNGLAKGKAIGSSRGQRNKQGRRG